MRSLQSIMGKLELTKATKGRFDTSSTKMVSAKRKAQSTENDPYVLLRSHWLTLILGSFSSPTLLQAFFAF
ncbi:MAG TPA: hypothetical protein VKF81_17815, partial [Blastocatellia bacterium]|nr:hypothetical protein [Blastocatellia bacterium]